MSIKEEEIKLPSSPLGREVTVTLLQPEGAEAALSLLVLNDGQDVPALRFIETLDNLYNQQKLRPLLVAAVHASEDRAQEYGTASRQDFKGRGAKAGAYTSFVVDELLPFLRQYCEQDTFGSTAIAGCSLGGLSALDIAWHHPEHFHKVGIFSGSFWWRSKDIKRGYRDDKHRIMHQIIRNTPGKPALKFWLEAGTADEMADRNKNGIIDAIDDTVDVIKELEAKGYQRPDDIVYREIVGGTHHPDTWAKAMPHFLSWAFGR